MGLKFFRQYLNSTYFTRTFTNTIRLSVLNLLFGFTMPIIFALLLNEVRNLKVKKTVQTISYLPHFISTVVVAGMVISFTDMMSLVPVVEPAVPELTAHNGLLGAECLEEVQILLAFAAEVGSSEVLGQSAAAQHPAGAAVRSEEQAVDAVVVVQLHNIAHIVMIVAV